MSAIGEYLWRVFCLEAEESRPSLERSHDTARELLLDRPRNISSLGTAQERGLGLGLHICRDFVKANDGTIEIDSQLNKGTTVSFMLPRAEGPEPAI